MPLRPMKAIAAAAAFATLAACASTGEAPPPSPGRSNGGAPSSERAQFRVRDVMGKGSTELDRQFGKPSLVRREGPGEYRRYTLKACQLIVILYPDETGAAVAGHVETAAKTANEQKPELAACLARG